MRLAGRRAGGGAALAVALRRRVAADAPERAQQEPERRLLARRRPEALGRPREGQRLAVAAGRAELGRVARERAAQRHAEGRRGRGEERRGPRGAVAGPLEEERLARGRERRGGAVGRRGSELRAVEAVDALAVPPRDDEQRGDEEELGRPERREHRADPCARPRPGERAHGAGEREPVQELERRAEPAAPLVGARAHARGLDLAPRRVARPALEQARGEHRAGLEDPRADAAPPQHAPPRAPPRVDRERDEDLRRDDERERGHGRDDADDAAPRERQRVLVDDRRRGVAPLQRAVAERRGLHEPQRRDARQEPPLRQRRDGRRGEERGQREPPGDDRDAGDARRDEERREHVQVDEGRGAAGDEAHERGRGVVGTAEHRCVAVDVSCREAA